MHSDLQKSFIRIHLRVLHRPLIDIDVLIAAARGVFDAAEIAIEVASIEHLDLADLLDVYIADCTMGKPTAAQHRLFQSGTHVSATDIVVYFVRSTIPLSTGCAAHPSDRPGLIITEIANRWTLAHELGHILGLTHQHDPDHLMSSHRTDGEASAPHVMTRIERLVLTGNHLVHKVRGSAREPNEAEPEPCSRTNSYDR